MEPSGRASVNSASAGTKWIPSPRRGSVRDWFAPEPCAAAARDRKLRRVRDPSNEDGNKVPMSTRIYHSGRSFLESTRPDFLRKLLIFPPRQPHSTGRAVSRRAHRRVPPVGSHARGQRAAAQQAAAARGRATATTQRTCHSRPLWIDPPPAPTPTRTTSSSLAGSPMPSWRAASSTSERLSLRGAPTAISGRCAPCVPIQNPHINRFTVGNARGA
jgi:hypothetical protein